MITIYPAKKAQITLQLAENVTVLAEYSDFADIFLEKSANILSEQTGVNEHTIKLEKGKQPPYGPIYNIRLVELKSLKNYIKTNLINKFIQTSKLPLGAPILFVCKPNNRFCFCVDY